MMERPRERPDIDHVRDAMQDLAEASEDEPQPDEPEAEPGGEEDVPGSEELDVEGPNESAPGRHPEPDEAARGAASRGRE
jgi:hypothetical protein